jgi:hypothetical protein
MNKQSTCRYPGITYVGAASPFKIFRSYFLVREHRCEMENANSHMDVHSLTPLTRMSFAPIRSCGDSLQTLREALRTIPVRKGM